MFSVKEKQFIANEIEKLLLAINHPEMPNEKPSFTLHVNGEEVWSFAEIKPNWKMREGFEKESNPWNEIPRDYPHRKKKGRDDM